MEAGMAIHLADDGMTGVDKIRGQTSFHSPESWKLSAPRRPFMMAVTPQSRACYGPVRGASEVSSDKDRWTDVRSPRTNR